MIKIFSQDPPVTSKIDKGESKPIDQPVTIQVEAILDGKCEHLYYNILFIRSLITSVIVKEEYLGDRIFKNKDGVVVYIIKPYYTVFNITLLSGLGLGTGELIDLIKSVTKHWDCVPHDNVDVAVL